MSAPLLLPFATHYSLFAFCALPLVLRLGRLAIGIDAQPARGREALLRQEAALVVHLLGALDPVAEIDIGQAEAAGAGNVVEDHEGAERAALLGWLEERIDHRQTVAEHVRERDRNQFLAAAGDAAVNAAPAVLDD